MKRLLQTAAKFLSGIPAELVGAVEFAMADGRFSAEAEVIGSGPSTGKKSKAASTETAKKR